MHIFMLKVRDNGISCSLILLLYLTVFLSTLISESFGLFNLFVSLVLSLPQQIARMDLYDKDNLIIQLFLTFH